jgi:small subunit ribosomal protein S6
LNVECSKDILDELTTNFRYNDAVLRHMVVRCDEAITSESPIMKAEQEGRERKARREERQARDDSQESSNDRAPSETTETTDSEAE